MPYSVPISRANPTAIVFLLDQSGSMREPFAGQPDKTKADGVADALNRLLQNLVLKCARADGVRDFFRVALIGYGGRVTSLFDRGLLGSDLVPVSRLANNPLRIEMRTRKVKDGAGGLTEEEFRFPVWFEARPGGKTPMCAALRKAKECLEGFVASYPHGYPPIVMNLTDGRPNDGDPRQPARELCDLATSDGNVLLFNAHLSDKQSRPVEFPAEEGGLPDDYARLLFRMSSELPPPLLEAAKDAGLAAVPKSRGFVFNADLVAVIRFLDIGTRVSQKVS
jgi:uncharacterized protein YegL